MSQQTIFEVLADRPSINLEDVRILRKLPDFHLLLTDYEAELLVGNGGTIYFDAEFDGYWIPTARCSELLTPDATLEHLAEAREHGWRG